MMKIKNLTSLAKALRCVKLSGIPIGSATITNGTMVIFHIGNHYNISLDLKKMSLLKI